MTWTQTKEALIGKQNKRKAKIGKSKRKEVVDKCKLGKDYIIIYIIQERIIGKYKKILQESITSTCQDNEDEDAECVGNKCLVCGELVETTKYGIHRCTFCRLWAHADCTEWDSACNYVCNMCWLQLPTCWSPLLMDVYNGDRYLLIFLQYFVVLKLIRRIDNNYC